MSHLKVLMCGIHASDAQLCCYIFILCYTHLKLSLLLHKTVHGNVSFVQHCKLLSLYVLKYRTLKPLIFLKLQMQIWHVGICFLKWCFFKHTLCLVAHAQILHLNFFPSCIWLMWDFKMYLFFIIFKQILHWIFSSWIWLMWVFKMYLFFIIFKQILHWNGWLILSEFSVNLADSFPDLSESFPELSESSSDLSKSSSELSEFSFVSGWKNDTWFLRELILENSRSHFKHLYGPFPKVWVYSKLQIHVPHSIENFLFYRCDPLLTYSY